MEQRRERRQDHSRACRELDGHDGQPQLPEGRFDRRAAGTSPDRRDVLRHRHSLPRQESGSVMKSKSLRDGSSRSGFTMIELLVGLVVGLIVLSSVVQMLIVQGHGYRKQREIVDIRETAREASALLAWDLRQSAVGGSPLAAIAANSIALRSPRGMGTICAKHPTLARYGLWKTGGNIFGTADDSALVY